MNVARVSIATFIIRTTVLTETTGLNYGNSLTFWTTFYGI